MTTAPTAAPSGAKTGFVPGLVAGIAANLLWGLVFLVPVLLADFSPVAITIGRFATFGLVSAFFLLATRSWGSIPHLAWPSAFLFALIGNVGYYVLLVQGVALAGAPIVAVIIGILPVTVALAGYFREPPFGFGRLVLPLGAIAAGLLIVNFYEVDWSGANPQGLVPQLLGLACAFAALGLWTWYGVANAHFMKAHPDLPSSLWTNMVGVATLALSIGLLPFMLSGNGPLVSGAPLDWASFGRLALGGLVLGLLASWVSTLLWNKASRSLPVSLAGQLIVFETLSGLFYVFIAKGHMPPLFEFGGFALVILGVLLSIRQFSKG
jgi:drug/metabolite transporter (DMT)-like permease